MEVKEHIFESMVLNIKQEKCSLIVDDDLSDSEEQLIKNRNNIDQQQQSLKDENTPKNNSSPKHSILTHKCSVICAWCLFPFAEFDNRNHIGRIRSIEKQNSFLKINALLKTDSCLCDRCWKFLEKSYKSKNSKTINQKSLSDSSSVHNIYNQQSFNTSTNNQVTTATNLMRDEESSISNGSGTSALEGIAHIEPMKENKDTLEYNEIVQIKSEKDNVSEHDEVVNIKLEEEIEYISEHNSFGYFTENSVNHISNDVINNLDGNTGATNNMVLNRLLNKDDNVEIDHYQTVYDKRDTDNSHYNPGNTNILYSNHRNKTKPLMPVITKVQCNANYINKNIQNVNLLEDISTSEAVYFNEPNQNYYSFISAESGKSQLRSAARRKKLPCTVTNLDAKKQRIDKNQSNRTSTYNSDNIINISSDENEETLINNINKVDLDVAGPLKFHRTLQKVPDYYCKEMSVKLKEKNCSIDNDISDDVFASGLHEPTENNSKSKIKPSRSVRYFDYSVKTLSPDNKKMNNVWNNMILELYAEMNNPNSSNYELMKMLFEQMNGDMNKIMNHLLMKEQMLLDGQLVVSELAEPEVVEYFNNHIKRLSNIQCTSDANVTSCLSSSNSSNRRSTADVYFPVKDNISISSLNLNSPSNSTISIPRNILNATYRLPKSKNNFKTITITPTIPTAVRSKGPFVQNNFLHPNLNIRTRRNAFYQK